MLRVNMKRDNGEKRGKKAGGKSDTEGFRTVHPADSQRLEDGEQQQAGSTAGKVVVDLEHVEPPLHRKAHQTPVFSRQNEQTWGRRRTHRRDHDQPHQEADDAHEQQQ